MQLTDQLELLLKLYADSLVDFLQYSIFKEIIFKGAASAVLFCFGGIFFLRILLRILSSYTRPYGGCSVTHTSGTFLFKILYYDKITKNDFSKNRKSKEVRA